LPEWDYLRAAVPMFGGGRTKEGVPESAFRAAYETVRPLPSGFDDRREAYPAVLCVSYLKRFTSSAGRSIPPPRSRRTQSGSPSGPANCSTSYARPRYALESAAW